MAFFQELKRRRVFKVAAIYLAVSFGALQGAQLLTESLHLPLWILTFLTVVALVAFPVVLALAWVFDVTPAGVERTLSNKGRTAASIAVSIIVVLVGVAAYMKVGQSAARRDAEGTRSIAVLPFINISGDKEQEYFSDGLTEELLNSLAQVPNLRVAARTSSFVFKGRNVAVSEIGQQLNVAAVMEGSVRKSGNRVRITAQLINVANGYHLWSHTYDYELTDIFAIQEQISTAITDALQVALGSNTAARQEKPDVVAYNLYLQGRFFWNKRTPAALARARELLEQAVQRDPKFARAHAALADVYLIASDYTNLPLADATPRLMAAAQRAIALDPSLAEPHATLATAYARAFDWQRSEAEYQRALALNPNYAVAHQWHGFLLSERGDLAGAVREFRAALQLDPLSPIFNVNLGTHLSMLGRVPDAEAQFRKAIELAPELETRVPLAAFLAYHDRIPEATAVADTIMNTAGEHSRHALAQMAFVYAKAGQKTRALQLARQVERDPRALEVASAYIALGDTAHAFKIVERSIASHDPTLNASGAMIGLNPLRKTSHFRALRQSMGLEE